MAHLADDMTCPICCEYIIEPTVTSCGHVFDLHCLRTWVIAQDAASPNQPPRCPSCRAPQLTSSFTICIPLQKALEQIAAPEFASRQAVAREADEIAALCRSGRLEALERLKISEDAAVWKRRLGARTADGSTALHAAAASGRSEIVRFLIASGADPTLQNDTGRDPLGVCAEGATARELLRASGTTLNRSGRSRFTSLPHFDRLSHFSPLDKALDRAIEDGREQVVVALLKRGGEPHFNALRIAAGRGHTATCEALLTHYRPHPDEDADDLQALGALEYLLMDDCDCGDPEVSRDQRWRSLVYLLRTYPWLRTTLTIPPEYDLWGAAWEAHVESGRDVSVLDDFSLPQPIWSRLGGDRAVRSAAQASHMTTLLVLLRHPVREQDPEADVDQNADDDSDVDDEDERSSLHYAAAAGTEEVVAALLNAGAEVDCEDDCQCTPLLLAAKRRDASAAGIVRRLLEARAEANHVDDESQTALHHAALSLSAEIMQVLLDVPDLTINATDASGNSPLLLVTNGGDSPLRLQSDDVETAKLRFTAAKMLLAAGADPRQVRESDLAAPLIAAVCRGPHAHPLVLQLLQHGALPCRESVGYAELQERRSAGLGDELVEEPLTICIRVGDIETAISLCRALGQVRHDASGIFKFTIADGFAQALARGKSDSFAMAEAIARCAVSDFGANAVAKLCPSPWAETLPPVHACAAVGAESVLQLLLEAQGESLAAVDAYDQSGPDDDFVQHGATVEKRTKVTRENRNEKFEGFTPLHAACHRGHIDLALLLIDAGADVNSRGVWHAVKGNDLREGKSDLSDVTPLHLAIARSHSKLAVRLLKHHGAAASLYEGGRRWPGKRLKHTDEFDDGEEDYWTRHEREQRVDKEDLTCTLALAASTDQGRVLQAVSEAARQLAAERGQDAGGGAPSVDPLRWLLMQPLAEPPERGCSRRSPLSLFMWRRVEEEPQTPEQIEARATARRAEGADQLLVRATYEAALCASYAGVRALLPHLLCREGARPFLKLSDRHIFWEPPLAPLACIEPGAADGDLCTVLLLAALAGGSQGILDRMLDSGMQPQTEANAELLLTAAVMHDSRAASSSSSAVRLQPGVLLQGLISRLKPMPLTDSQAAEQSPQRPEADECFTALHAAALVGNVGAIAALAKVTCLKQPPESHFDQPDRDGFTPAHYAAMGRFRVIEPGDAHPRRPAYAGFAAQHFSWIGAPTSDRMRGGAKRQGAAQPEAWTAACSDRGETSAEVLRSLSTAARARCVDRGRLQGCSLLELAVHSRRDKVVIELLRRGNGRPGNRRENVENALAAVREQISSGTARAVSLNPDMDSVYDPGERVHKAAHPGLLLKLSNADVQVARDIEGMLIRELGAIGKRKRES